MRGDAGLGRGSSRGEMGQAYLVTVAPLIILGPYVLVGVLDTLLERREMRPMVPMLVPQVVGVGGSNHKGGNRDTVSVVSPSRSPLIIFPGVESKIIMRSLLNTPPGRRQWSDWLANVLATDIGR